ncbi:MAG: hypothetical protein GC164_08810 [Phycisphaera sp.]|nr:hypothetical protein [Phycisphaera sp.]
MARWDNYNMVDNNNTHAFGADPSYNDMLQPGIFLMKDCYVDRFEATFRTQRSSSFDQLGFVFGAVDGDHMQSVVFQYDGTAPYAMEVDDGGEPTFPTATRTSTPTVGAGETLWVRITYDGTTVTAKAQKQTSEPSDGSWSTATTYLSSTAYSGASGGGRIGFQSVYAYPLADNLTLKTDRDENGSYETTEHADGFTTWHWTGNAPDKRDTDAAGNLTYDGHLSFTYDAWNRLLTVSKAYKADSANGDDITLAALATGSVVNTIQYDGLGRRIVKAVTNSAYLDCTYHYYYAPGSQRIIEERNGSQDVIRQLVWGQMYIDELVQIGLNDDPADGVEDDVESFYWALHNANFNVIGVVDDSGVLVERYEYEPYGQRTVYFSSGSNDPDCYAPTNMSRAWSTSGGGTTVYGTSGGQPWSLNPVGHQGLMHDEETGLIHNRARMRHTTLGRFMQRDSKGYIDGLSLYASYFSMHFSLDPFGYQEIYDRIIYRRHKGETRRREGDFLPARTRHPWEDEDYYWTINGECWWYKKYSHAVFIDELMEKWHEWSYQQDVKALIENANRIEREAKLLIGDALTADSAADSLDQYIRDTDTTLTETSYMTTLSIFIAIAAPEAGVPIAILNGTANIGTQSLRSRARTLESALRDAATERRNRANDLQSNAAQLRTDAIKGEWDIGQNFLGLEWVNIKSWDENEFRAIGIVDKCLCE